MSKMKDTFRLSLIAPSVCVTGMGSASNGHQGLQSAKSEETYLPHALRALLSSSDNGGLSLCFGMLALLLKERSSDQQHCCEFLIQAPSQSRSPGIHILNWWTNSNLKYSTIELVIVMKFRRLPRKLTL